MPESDSVHNRINNLEQHLKEENPVLVDVIRGFRDLDLVSRRMGFFSKEQSHAFSVPWWPLISVLGVYSSGKSTFINRYLNYNLQDTGNQAVDDKFTVICFSDEDRIRQLPGLALDADPRFPLYKITEAIDAATPGEGRRVDAYLQLKTCPSEKLRGNIIIDSPGFDADAQRTATLSITRHILDLSDLVLVFFDARHPESGSMSDTLETLVKGTIHRNDSNKFLYILNQIDMTAREDNPEQVFAAWQRALAQKGMTAGQCFTIYDPEAGMPIEDEGLRERFLRKRDTDVAGIQERIEEVRVARAYRIVGMLGQKASVLETDVYLRIQAFLENWRRRVCWLNCIFFGLFLACFLAITLWAGYWNGFSLKLPYMDVLMANPLGKWTLAAFLAALLIYIHMRVRRWAGKQATRKILAGIDETEGHENYIRAFNKNTRWWRSIFRRKPAGWSRRNTVRLAKLASDANGYVQKLNDVYANPAGKTQEKKAPEEIAHEDSKVCAEPAVEPGKTG
ncbi:MAG: dynamin family protein [Desulfobacteraceae bacterium 4572_87]|nr:MAG: dynamin family protein [Desulfobacteraceae bacterium 4572_87]